LKGSSRHTQRIRDALSAHPVIALVTSCGLLLALAAPVLDMDVSSPTMAILPSSVDARQMYDTIDS